LPALLLPATRKWLPVTGKNPDQAGSVRARSKTRGRYCVLRAGALDCAQSEDASTTAEPGITGETVKGSCARMADRALKIFSAAHRETRKARKDAMPHERGSCQCPLSNFLPLSSPIAKSASAANDPLPDHRQRPPRLTLGKPLTQKNLTRNIRPRRSLP